jgi:predicted NUDIX family NTP pyrophosphohydrolase
LPRRSAGLLVYRSVEDGIEVLAVHPGGPFWAMKDAGAWSIPKGEIEIEQASASGLDRAGGLDGAGGREEEPYVAARREFEEELGQPAPVGEPLDLGHVRQGGGKIVHAWALLANDGDVDVESVKSNMVSLEWPKGTGRILSFPEVDRAEWMSPEVARTKLNQSQVVLLERLLEFLGA